MQEMSDQTLNALDNSLNLIVNQVQQGSYTIFWNPAVQNILAEIGNREPDPSTRTIVEESLINMMLAGDYISSIILYDEYGNSYDCVRSGTMVKNEINIEEIVNEITCEPQNAYVSEEPLEVHADQDGISLAISIDEAKNILKEDKEEYEIPLNITEADIKVEDLGEDAFPNLLGTCTTNYDASNINRNNNLMLAAEKINGTIVNPGETFSYNQTVGQRTIAAGFKEAKAYANGKVVLDVGGGVCQLSSTLYNSALFSNLEIIERRSHYFKTSYLPAGRDATVSWGSVDFKFKNNREYPIKIVAIAQDGVVKVDIYGIKQEDDYDVAIESQETSIIPVETIYEEDKSLEEGEQVTVQNGENGCTSETYKILSKNGVVVSKTLISKDTYNDLPTIIKKNKK